jgi:hypothetical protein
MKLSTAARKALPSSAFVFPEKAPGSGSYPIPDRAHAVDALSRASGKPEEAAVRAAVCRKFGLGCKGQDAEDRRDGGRDESTEKS